MLVVVEIVVVVVTIVDGFAYSIGTTVYDLVLRPTQCLRLRH